MSSIKPSTVKKSEAQRLKEFGQVMCLVLTLISGWLFFQEKNSAFWMSAAAAVFLVLAVFRPLALAGFERRWMWLGEKMSIVVTFVIVTLTFYLMITPIGVAMRLFGMDLLATRLDKNKESYWVPVEEDGPHSRPFLPY